LTVRALFVDAGGVLVLPHRDLVARAVRSAAGAVIDPAAVAQAHYRAVARMDAEPALRGVEGHFSLMCRELGVPEARLAAAVRALAQLGDRAQSGEILWSEPTPGAVAALERLAGAGLPVVVVTNSDGHADRLE
jgi:phosphoglycolate phosphatase-like HAD superfamily hydrolase